MSKMGRPVIYTPKFIEDCRQKLEEYTKETEIPIVCEFCYLNDIRRERVYEFGRENENFSHTLKKCIDKKEAQLEKLGLIGACNPTMAIFSLKQLGWRDKIEINKDDKLEKLLSSQEVKIIENEWNTPENS